MPHVSANQNQIQTIQNKLDRTASMNSRICAETIIRFHDDRLKLLLYKSMDNEARNRRNNLSFKGIAEERNEDCFRQVEEVLIENVNISTKMYMHRAHRLGCSLLTKLGKSSWPFAILGSLKLHSTQFGISPDYPAEIVKARQKMWPEFKRFKQEAGPSDRISVSYPAKLVMNRKTKIDIFHGWNRIMKGSSVSFTDSTAMYENPVKSINSRISVLNEGPGLSPKDT